MAVVIVTMATQQVASIMMNNSYSNSGELAVTQGNDVFL